jgi:RNA polymerase sigma-70 factor, ECF subfamily
VPLYGRKSHFDAWAVLIGMHLIARSTDSLLSRLTKRAQHGDLQAFQELYRTLYPIVSRYVLRRLGDRAEAEDVVAHAFVQLVAKLPEISPGKGGALAFVCATARNRMIDSLRARRSGVCIEEAMEELVEPRTPLSELLDQEDQVTVSRCIASFPAPLQEMFALRYADGLSCAAIAQLIGVPEVAVRKRFSRALREIRLRIQPSPAGAREEQTGGCAP